MLPRRRPGSGGRVPVLIFVALVVSVVSSLGANQVIRTVGLAAGSALCGLVLAAATVPGRRYPSEGGYSLGAWLGTALMLASLALALTVAHRTRPALPSPA
jgi:hypothetical protein